MNASSFAALALVVVVVAWAGLTIARTAGERYIQKVKSAYEAHDQAHHGEPGDMPPLVRWDVEKGQLVPVRGDTAASDTARDPAHWSRARRPNRSLYRSGEQV